MADKVRKLKDDATRALAKGRTEEALKALLEVVKLEPRDVTTRQKCGDLYRKLSQNDKAIEAYQAVAGAYAADGLLLKAIAVCKVILLLDSHHVETQRILADLYARKRGGSTTQAELPAAMAAAVQPATAPSGKKSASSIRGMPATSIPTQPHAAKTIAIEEDEHLIVTPELPAELRAAEEDEEELELDTSGKAVQSSDAMMAALMGGQGPAPTPAFQPPADLDAAPLELGMPGEPPVVAGAVLEDEAPLPQGAVLEIDDVDVEEAEAEPPAVVLGEVEDASAQVMVEVQAGAASFAVSSAEASFFTEGEPTLAVVEGFEVEAEEELPEPVPVAVDLERLPPIPLFSDLGRTAFIDLLNRITVRHFEAGEVVLTEGDVGASFFVIVSGSVSVARKAPQGPVLLARLVEGAFFGEMALLGDGKRRATVTCDEAAELFELDRATLDGLVAEHPSMAQVLMRFYKQRLLNNLLHTSPIFAPFDKETRRGLIEKFKSREIPKGEPILAEGQMGDGLYIIVSGRCEVTRQSNAEAVTLAVLKEGDLFGEISLLTRSPATATVVTTVDSTVLRLPRKTFNEVVMVHPQILDLVSTLSDKRAAANASAAVTAPETAAMQV